jgi:hypothetical protein
MMFTLCHYVIVSGKEQERPVAATLVVFYVHFSIAKPTCKTFHIVQLTGNFQFLRKPHENLIVFSHCRVGNAKFVQDTPNRRFESQPLGRLQCGKQPFDSLFGRLTQKIQNGPRSGYLAHKWLAVSSSAAFAETKACPA